MKQLIESIVRLRNPAFRFDPAVSSGMLCQLAWEKGRDFLRAYRLLLRGRAPKRMMLGKGVQFFALGRIRWGQWVKIEEGVRLSGLGRGYLTLGNNVGIGAHSRIEVASSFNNLGSHITLGDNVGLGPFAHLGGAGGLEIGAGCIIGPYLSCHPENHVFSDLEVPIRHQGVTRQGIRIGANCWIGAKVTILDGVEIGEGSVIAAGAVVTQSMPAFSVIGGVPARLLKSRIQPQEVRKTA